MPVRIRLRRVGRKKQPSYRVVVAQSSAARSGAYLDNVGFYNPRQDPIELKLDLEKIDQWIAKGAQMTPTVASLVRKARSGAVALAEAKPAAKAAPKAEEATPALVVEEAVTEAAAEGEEPAAEA